MTAFAKTECTLFYRADPDAAFHDLAECLTEAFARTNIRLRPRFSAYSDLAFALGGLTMTVSRSMRALDLSPFATIGRPEAGTMSVPQVRRRLSQHRSAVVIRVTGPEHLAKLETRLALCYIATMQMMQLDEPNMIHWARSNILYTIEEFRCSTGAHKPVRPLPAKILPQVAASGARPRSISAWLQEKERQMAEAIAPKQPNSPAQPRLRKIPISLDDIKPPAFLSSAFQGQAIAS